MNGEDRFGDWLMGIYLLISAITFVWGIGYELVKWHRAGATKRRR